MREKNKSRSPPVKRNIERFPDDFMFEPTIEELENLRSQIGISSLGDNSEPGARPSLRSQFVTSNVGSRSEARLKRRLRSQIGTSSLSGDFIGRGGSRYRPYVFAEPGVAMLSTVLNSEKAIQTSIGIIRVFIQLRKQQVDHPKSQSVTIQVDLFPRVESLETKLETLAQRFDQFEVRHQDRASLMASDRVGAIQHAARRFGLKVADLKSATRTRAISIPRQIAIYLLRTHLCMGFSEIGEHFGRRDHTTILHAYHKIHAESDSDNMIRKAIQSLQNEIQALPCETA